MRFIPDNSLFVGWYSRDDDEVVDDADEVKDFM